MSILKKSPEISAKISVNLREKFTHSKNKQIITPKLIFRPHLANSQKFIIFAPLFNVEHARGDENPLF